MDCTPIPAHLQAYVDHLVDQASLGVRLPVGPAFDLVTSWYETLDSSVTVRAGSSATIPVVTLFEAVSRAHDDDIRWHAELSDDTSLPERGDVTDAMRVAAVRRHLRNLLGEGDPIDDLPSSACAVVIEGSNGQRAVLCYSVSGDWEPMSGPDIEWEGIRQSLDIWRRELVEQGVIMTLTEAEALTDSEILGAWRKMHCV